MSLCHSHCNNIRLIWSSDLFNTCNDQDAYHLVPAPWFCLYCLCVCVLYEQQINNNNHNNIYISVFISYWNSQTPARLPLLSGYLDRLNRLYRPPLKLSLCCDEFCCCIGALCELIHNRRRRLGYEGKSPSKSLFTRVCVFMVVMVTVGRTQRIFPIFVYRQAFFWTFSKHSMYDYSA